MKTKCIAADLAHSALTVLSDAGHPRGLSFCTTLPSCKRIASRHIFLKVQIEDLGDSDDPQLKTQDSLKANFLLIETIQESWMVSRLLGKCWLQVWQRNLHMPSICHLCTHQQSKGNMMGHKWILSRFKNLDVFQVQSQRVNKPHANTSALLLLVSGRRQRVRPLTDDGFRRRFTGETAVKLLFWERNSGARGADWNWLLLHNRLVNPEHFSQVNSNTRPPLFRQCWRNPLKSNKPPFIHVW